MPAEAWSPSFLFRRKERTKEKAAPLKGMAQLELLSVAS